MEEEGVVPPPGEGAGTVDAGRHEHGVREGGDEAGAGGLRVRNLRTTNTVSEPSGTLRSDLQLKNVLISTRIMSELWLKMKQN